jgi:hypothetical protein
MRPYDFYDIDQLRLAHSRAEELRAAWQTANFRKAPAGPAAPPSAPSVGRAVRLARSAAGRVLIGIGQRMLPAETGPCA